MVSKEQEEPWFKFLWKGSASDYRRLVPKELRTLYIVLDDGDADGQRMIKYRPHRGQFAEAMAEAVELPDGAALLRHIRRTSWVPGTAGLWARPYGGVDPRNGWDTYVVLVEDLGPVGFMDGPVPELCGPRPEWAARYCEPQP